jgi:uncharacterized Zn finger protein (UPF0148 family)
MVHYLINEDCNVPLMRSKQGDEICFGCQKNYKLNQKPTIAEGPRKEPVSNSTNIKPV